MSEDNGSRAPRTPREVEIPEVLRREDRWIQWDYAPHPVSGEPTKRPRGSLLDPSLGAPFASVCKNDRIGFMFTGGVDTPSGRLHALDIDGCRDPNTGTIEPWALEVIHSHGDSFTEITTSGTGLRQWLIVANPPKGGISKIRPPHPAPEGVDKKPEVQVFGSGTAQYVTVTGYHLPGTEREIRTVLDFSWLQRAYGAQESEVLDAELPQGVGQPPPFEVIRERVTETGIGELLLDGYWHPETPSASEAWFRLVQMVLAAAENHGETAAEFLLNATPWGQGLIDSRDPGRYARREWVMRDIARIGGKTDARSASELFDDDFDADAWEPPLGIVLRDPSEPWLIKGSDYIGQKREPLPFVVYDFLPVQGLVQFFGKPSCGKTPFALSLALSIACGRPQWCDFDIDRHGPVVYMVGEGGPGLANRILGQLERYDDCSVPFEEAPFYATTRPGELTNKANCEQWVKHIRKTVGADQITLLVVDTQNMNFGPGNESDTEDMTKFFVNLKLIARVLECAVVLVHHVGHQEQERARGNSVQDGALDATVWIQKHGMVAKATPVKTKDWETPEPILAHLAPIKLGEDRKGRPITAITLIEGEIDPGEVFCGETPDELQKLLRAVEETEGRPTTQSGLATLAGVGRRIIRDLIEQAVGFGLIDVKSTGRGSRKTTYHLRAKSGQLDTSDVNLSDTNPCDERDKLGPAKSEVDVKLEDYLE